MFSEAEPRTQLGTQRQVMMFVLSHTIIGSSTGVQ